jgi:hypothetical protein
VGLLQPYASGQRRLLASLTDLFFRRWPDLAVTCEASS